MASGTYYVNYAILNGSGAVVGPGACIQERFLPPRSMEEINRLSDRLTDWQRSVGAIRAGEWLSVMGWSEMGR